MSKTSHRLLETAMARHRAGDLGGAATLYRDILAQNPEDADALHLLGVIARQTGKHAVARGLMESALKINPAHVQALANYSLILREEGRLDEAEDAARKALSREPSSIEALSNLGAVLLAKGDHEGAADSYRKAVGHAPRDPEQANNLAVALLRTGEIAEACAASEKAISLDARRAHFHNTRGNILRAAGRPDLAAEAFAEAVARDPGFNDARVSEAMARLVTGDMRQGFALYEARGKSEERYARLRPWEGGDVSGETVLLRAEQGFGDTLQFIRYLPRLQEKLPRLIVEAQPELLSLLQTSFPAVSFLSRSAPIPAQATHAVRLLSLPFLFGTELESVPSATPYLRVDPARFAAWSMRMREGASPRVGLVWAGNPRHLNDRNRSVPPSALGPLLDAGASHLVSLQKGAPVVETAALPGIAEACADFHDTAAAIMNLDLVITVDTAVAHLTGALGRPVWVLLPFDPDWRWLMEREDSPWYPSCRLFRQAAPRDWAGVLARVAQELRRLKSGDRACLSPAPWQGPAATQAKNPVLSF